MYFSFHGTKNIVLEYFLTDETFDKLAQSWATFSRMDRFNLRCCTNHLLTRRIEINIPMSGDAILCMTKDIFFCRYIFSVNLISCDAETRITKPKNSRIGCVYVEKPKQIRQFHVNLMYLAGRSF